MARTNHSLDVESMRSASKHLVGTHDFKSYAASDHQGHTTIRTIKRINVESMDADLIRFEVTGTGFLKQMVRNLVGSLMEVGREHRSPDWVESVLNAQDRSAAGPTAPARGLTLWHSDVNWLHGKPGD